MCVLFDLDGTLLDTAPDFIRAVVQMRAENKLPALSHEQLKHVRSAVSHGIGMLVKTGFEISSTAPNYDGLCKRLLDLYQKNLGENTRPFPGIKACLQALERNKIPWGVVTNKHRFLTEPLMAQQNLASRAACIVSGDSTPYAKPHPAPLLYACQQIGISPEHCIYIGDAERDIIAGKSAGMTTIAALFGYIEDVKMVKQWSAHHYIHHANEIYPWVEQWMQLTR